MRAWLALLLLVLVPGCLINHDLYQERLDALTDNDGDGLHEDDGDCDDNDPRRRPGLGETCDGLDNDCDGRVDENPTGSIYLPDVDRDGYGDPTSPVATCSPSPEQVQRGGDCDDLDPDTHPGADERCDRVDNDCDGVADNEATDAPTWYQDQDGDDYGVEDAPITTCDAPSGYAALAGDCDDADPASHPGAAEDCDSEVDLNCDGFLGSDDHDGDGFLACEECDDGDRAVFPGAAERCNNLDDDCDGDLDEDDAVDALTWWLDADEDGYGGSSSRQACEQPVGYLAESDDCDDLDPDVHPGATEACNGLDDDCDALVDDADTGVSGRSTWWRDVDGDTYGGSATSAQACAQPSGYSSNSTDCDDSRATVHPGATETCNDRDDDCDGGTDEGLTLTTWYTDSDGDNYGNASSPVMDCARPGGTVADATDCDDTEPTTNPGATEVCNDGIDNDCDSSPGSCALTGTISLASADAKWTGVAAGDYAGWAVSSAGDTNGDGFDDILVGARSNDSLATDGGAVYLLLGPATSGGALSTARAEIQGTLSYSHLGRSVTGYDLDADGYSDAILGASGYDNASIQNTGAGFIFMGPLSGTVSNYAADVKLQGSTANAQSFYGVDAGDIDGDGALDIVAGAPGHASSSTTPGAVHLLFGPFTNNRTLNVGSTTIVGTAHQDRVGEAVAVVGDLDGDGLDDILIGADSNDVAGSNAGAVYLLYGPGTGHSSLSSADGRLLGAAAGDGAGAAVAGVGDLSGDGYGDILIGAPNHDSGGTDAGAAYLVLGPASGSSALSGASGRLDGQSLSENAGTHVGLAGDTDGDGVEEILVGAPDHGGLGAVYLVSPPISGTISLSLSDALITGDSVSDLAATISQRPLDADGDGYTDIVIGGIGDATGGSTAGAVWILRGLGL